jgi:CheY-like chemotaxis protein
VLVVERRTEVRSAVRAALSAAGHEVVEVDDAGVGLAAYEATPADVVLLAVHNSGRLDATSFMRRLRRAFPEARVVTIAGRASWGVSDPLAVTQGLGAVRTLRMPLSREDLLRAVDEARA